MAQIVNADSLLNPKDGTAAWTQSQIDEYNKQLVILQQFRSYSYHHVLIVANTTEVAQAIFSSSEFNSSIDSYLHPSQATKYAPQSVSSLGDAAGQYIVLINGMTDADFLIDTVEWEAIFQPDAGESNPHSSFVEGTMEIQEPKGIAFMNLLKTSCDLLKTDPSGLVFVLKTIFVGWTDDISQSSNQAQVQQVINVNPLTFVAQDIQASFTNTGSMYTLSFVGQVNGVSRMPEFGTIQSSGLVPAGTIGAAVQNLQDSLNQASQKAHDTLVSQLDESNKTPTASTSTTPADKFAGRLVTYNFVVDPSFKDLAMDNVNPRLAQNSSDSGPPTPQGIDIDSALTDIMLCSSVLMQMHNKDLKSGWKNVFKIESSIDSTMTTVSVTYNVKPCKVPVVVKDNTANQGNILDPFISGRPVIQFEYLYTGKNVEVLEYDMKMVMGLAFFQLYNTNNVLSGNFFSASGNVQSVSNGPGTVLSDKSTNMRPLTPITLGAQVKDPNSNNKPATGDTATFRMFMARWAFAESVQTKIKIAGIPKLLDGFNLLAKDVAASGVAQAEGLPLVKIHVKYPNDPADFATNGQYASDFWYDGSFLLLSVKNSFRDGRFEQELNINAIPTEEMVAVATDGASTGTTTSPSSSTTNSNAGVSPQSTSATGQKVTPVITPEQKAKHDTAAPSVTPDTKYDCTTILSVKYTTLADCQKVQLTPDWTLADFIRRQINVTNDAKILTNLCRVATELEKVQAWLGVKISITSAYRSPAFNNSVKGASSTSDHMKGLAVDCQFAGLRPQDVWNKLKTSPFKFRQCIWEHFGSSSWVHMAFDVDPSTPVQNTARFFELPHSRVA